MIKKLRSKKAETLLESLISLLIASMSITLLSTCVMSAASTNKKTRDADAVYTENLACAEMKSVLAAEKQRISISFDEGGILVQSVEVDMYGKGAFVSYEKRETP